MYLTPVKFIWFSIFLDGTFGQLVKIEHPQVNQTLINSAVRFGESAVNKLQRLETSLVLSNIRVKHPSAAHWSLLQSAPNPAASAQGKFGLIALKATSQILGNWCYKHKISSAECLKTISNYNFLNSSLHNFCLSKIPDCESQNYWYRTVDGSCNSKNNIDKGISNSEYGRLLMPKYLDGIYQMRRSVTKQKLPSSRLISLNLVENIKYIIYKNDISHALVTWTDFIANDLSHTATSGMIHIDESIECCSVDGENLSPRYLHPFCEVILVPENDKLFNYYNNTKCLHYVRSMPAVRSDCNFGPFDQINQATHFMDGSQIYGSFNEKSRAIRTFEKGLLKYDGSVEKMFLLKSKSSEECKNIFKNKCYISGDERSNSYPDLAILHTVWLREHNRIAKQLSIINPHWSDELIYQEARKITIAELQHITYEEWLPVVLGTNFKLESVHRDMATKDPSVSNSFATAAIRFSNFLRKNTFKILDEDRIDIDKLMLMEFINVPTILEDDKTFDGILRYLTTEKISPSFNSKENVDGVLIYSLQSPPVDLISIDIQRGRDHGLPSYNEFRVLCGLPNAETFHDYLDVMSEQVIQLLDDLYESPDDIDLIVGGALEIPIDDSLLGPTLSCIISDQMYRTKVADNYFYAVPGQFTKTQLRSIQNVTLGKILCDNSIHFKNIQQHVFSGISERNPLLSCDSLPSLNINFWKSSS